MLYGFLSDFGRSFFRPAALLVAMWVGFATFYWSEQSEWAKGTTVTSAAETVPKINRPFVNGFLGLVKKVAGSSEECGAGVEGPASSHAFFLSTKNALLGLGGVREEETRQAYKCLYGKRFRNGTTTADAKKPEEEPIIPGSVTYASYAQNIIGVICFWFMALAARNMFRQK